MAEKGDGGSDTVSLPPTYAPSEAYTESPPPAYRGGRGSGKTVQIVKLVCVTAVVIAFLSGFFVLASHYMKTRACTCDPRPLDSVEGRAALLHAGFLPPPPPAAEALVGEKKVEKVEKKEEEEEINENTLDAGDDPVFGDDQVDALVEEVVEAEHQLEEEMKEVVEEEEEALQDILRAQADHMKKIRLPIDLIMGNPNLAGKEVNCEVERRQVPIAPGVMSQTILVTCKDDEDQDKAIPRPKPSLNPFPAPRPPMSLIAPLMKMLTSRPGPQPRLVPIFPPRASFGPKTRISPVVSLTPLSQHAPVMSHGPPVMPHGAPEPRGNPEGLSDRMLPRHLQPIVRITPRFLSQARETTGKINMVSLQRGALPLPQATPRAPPSPISLSPFPPRPIMRSFLPFKVLADTPTGLSRPRPATHMEMKAEEKDFGPPRGHTLIQNGRQLTPVHPSGPIRPPPRLITLPKAIRVHTLPRNTPFNTPGSFEASPPRFEASPPRFEASPPRFEASPPRFAPEGRRAPPASY
ncbi:uncharacterized protein LOC123519571 isoform X2 [Portunus trituberculatus]|uniref:uncharacterized protein LOC123519571 isoform X2 n=1 Tax=Portunus trituberculatus TaxID=210409 RepID=UPI001E1D0264|nr:uncharacterized protein LOC123519571 isoform X2 [Portunus trituberculatus]